jgi:hypothetical protein
MTSRLHGPARAQVLPHIRQIYTPLRCISCRAPRSAVLDALCAPFAKARFFTLNYGQTNGTHEQALARGQLTHAGFCSIFGLVEDEYTSKLVKIFDLNNGRGWPLARGSHSFTLELNLGNSRTQLVIRLDYTVDTRAQVELQWERV